MSHICDNSPHTSVKEQDLHDFVAFIKRLETKGGHFFLKFLRQLLLANTPSSRDLVIFVLTTIKAITLPPAHAHGV